MHFAMTAHWTMLIAYLLLHLVVGVRGMSMRNRREFKSRPGCPRVCFNKDRYRTVLNRELQKARDHLRRFAEGETDGLLVNFSPDKWPNYCEEIGNIRSCLLSCTHPSDNSTVQIADACLNFASSAVCNADIRSSMSCLTEISSQLSEDCKDKCNHHKQLFVRTYEAFTKSRPISPDDPDKAIEGLCRLVHCRLFCRKEEIIEQCQTSGFEAAKALARAFGHFLQRFSDHSSHGLTISGYCTPERLIEAPS